MQNQIPRLCNLNYTSRAAGIPVINGFSIIFNIRNNGFSWISVIFLILEMCQFYHLLYLGGKRQQIFQRFGFQQGLTGSSIIKCDSVLLNVCDQVVKPRQTFGDRSYTQVVAGCLRSLEITESIFEAGGSHSSLWPETQDILRHKSW